MVRQDELELARRLLAEARSDATPFSPLLHERIIARLRTAGMVGATTLPRRRSPIAWRITGGLATAAAIGAAVWVILNPTPKAQIPHQEIVKEALPTITPSHIVAPVNALLGENTSKKLDE